LLNRSIFKEPIKISLSVTLENVRFKQKVVKSLTKTGKKFFVLCVNRWKSAMPHVAATSSDWRATFASIANVRLYEDQLMKATPPLFLAHSGVRIYHLLICSLVPSSYGCS